jgi:hypothetical protein
VVEVPPPLLSRDGGLPLQDAPLGQAQVERGREAKDRSHGAVRGAEPDDAARDASEPCRLRQLYHADVSLSSFMQQRPAAALPHSLADAQPRCMLTDKAIITSATRLLKGFLIMLSQSYS